MEVPPFASLGVIRILLIPLGNVQKRTFDKWASLIRSVDTIKLGDIPPDSRDDRTRFMPPPLSSGHSQGHIHLTYLSHPPPVWHAPLAIFRPSDFPLGIIGISEASGHVPLSNILGQFNAEIAQLFSANSMFPLAQNCYVFEGSGETGSLNMNETYPGMVLIPNVMGNKELYVGTLIAEMCSTILGEFSNLARAIESGPGMEALNATLFPIITPHPGDSQALSSPSLPSDFKNATGMNGAGRPVASRSKTFKAAASSKTSKRQSGMSVPPTGKLFKVLGDLFLLAGRTSDAAVWYTESIAILSKSSQDAVWQASALEGQATVQIIDAWNAGQGLHTSISSEGDEPWADIADKLTNAASIYSRATPLPGSSSPQLDSSQIMLLYIQCICRHTALLFSIWASKGWGSLAFATLIHSGLPPAFTPSRPDNVHLLRMSNLTRISRGQIANLLAQAHGPFMLHLEPHDRLRLLQYMATVYSCLGFRRKEAFILRELLTTIMDILVCGRDEMVKSPLRERDSVVGSILDVGGVGVRESESLEGNESIIRLVKYVCEIYGLDLTAVKLLAEGDNGNCDDEIANPDEVRFQYGWDELQLGVVREAVAIVETLPDHATVAQFDLSALKLMRSVLNPTDQSYLYANSTKSLLTARRRGEERKAEYWSGNPVSSIQITPLSFVRLPVEHSARDLFPPVCETGMSAVVNRDPFIYNPRLSTSTSKTQPLIVQHEPMEFILTFQNNYSFDLEIQSVSLSTSGVPLEVQPLTVTIAANSYHVARVMVTALEPGILIVRGCIVQTQGGAPREFLLPLTTDADDSAREKQKTNWMGESEKIKESGLDARPWLRSKRMSVVKAKSPKQKEFSFVQCKVVPQPPLMRIRRTSLTHGAIMLYDGETSTIRITVENVSIIPIEFIRVTCTDSTMGPAQQALADGELSVFETYETEYELLRHPVFQWDMDNEPSSIAPGRRVVLTIICSGKVGCTNGTIQISYSNIRKDSLTPSDSFYTRQVIYPVLVTVYNTLECLDMDILPLTSAGMESTGLNMMTKPDVEELKSQLESMSGDEWCMFSVNVRNTYGIPFEVTFKFSKDGIQKTATKLVAPGSTVRIILPIKRFMLPESQIAEPIPTLSDRQFVVSKSKLSAKEEHHRRALFWYREELFKSVVGSWREAGGSRFGDLSLRQQRFTVFMLDTLRTSRACLKLSISGHTSEPNFHLSNSLCQPNQFVYLRAAITNQTSGILTLSMTLTMTPSEYILYDGVISNTPVGKLNSEETRMLETGLCFISEGRFDLTAELTVVSTNPEEEVVVGHDHLRIWVRDGGWLG